MGACSRLTAFLTRLVERSRENNLHDVDGVGIQALLDLAGFEGAHVRGAQASQLDAAEEGYQVIAAGSFVGSKVPSLTW